MGNGGWKLHADASLDFFGIATLSGSIDLDSEGGFDVQLRGRMVIGSSSFGLIGEFHFRVRSQVLERTPFGNTYIFELSGGASVEARVFGITLAGVGLDFSFTAQGAGRTQDRAERHRPHPPALRHDQEDGALHDRLPGAAAARLPRGRGGQLRTSGIRDSELVLNVGPAAPSSATSAPARRTRGTSSSSSTATRSNATIKVSAFGRSNTFTGVTSILGNFGDGDDQVTIADNVKIPVTLNMGAGDDVVIYSGRNATSTIDGDSGYDYIETARRSARSRRSTGGADGDFIVNNGAGKAIVDGGSGDDRIIGGSALDQLDGGDGDDHISGPAASIIAGDGDDLVELTFDPSRPTIQGGIGDDDRLVLHLTDGRRHRERHQGRQQRPGHPRATASTSAPPASRTSSSTAAAVATPSRSATSTTPASAR